MRTKTKHGTKNEAPNGYVEILEQFLSTWDQYKPFVTITVENGEITSMADNSEARAAQEAADALAPPSDSEILAALIAKLAEKGIIP